MSATAEPRPLLDVRGITLQYKTREHLVTATYRVDFRVQRSKFRGHHTYFGEMPRRQAPRALINGRRFTSVTLRPGPEGVSE
ncbi:MAG: hypothetical protein WCI75_05885, partial [candidate division NC10 bacterium]